MTDYRFDTTISQQVLRNYLAHATSAQWICFSDTLDDDIRVMKKLGIKFLGRSTGIWKMDTPDEEHFRITKQSIEKIHAADPDIICQACIFEYINREDMSSVKVPARVFEAFGLPVEDRCFNYEAACMPGDESRESGCPDISRTECQLWFYYRAISYIDCGAEAFHMGQIHIYTACDRDYSGISKVIDLMREYGRKNARRHKILLDAHSHSIVKNGRSLLDYNAMPYTRFPVLDRPGEKLVLVREGKSGGGINPDGEYVKILPFLYEYDNWGGKDEWAHNNLSYEQRAWAQWWGYDQIRWFAEQPEEERNKFLDYTYKWTAVNNPDAFFAFPLRRPMISGENYEGFPFYKINNNSDECPDGFSQEDAAAALLCRGDEEYRSLANPSDILDYGCRDVDDPETGVRLPEKVVCYGSFQHCVGAVDFDSNSEITRMYYIGDNTYTLAFVMPYAGEYDFAVSTWGTLSACVDINGGKRIWSGSGGRSPLVIEKDNTVVRITFNYMTNEITVTKAE